MKTHCFSAIEVEHAAVDRCQHLRVVVAQVLPIWRANYTHVSVAVRVLRAGLVGRGQVEMLVQAAQAFERRVLQDRRMKCAYAGPSGGLACSHVIIAPGVVALHEVGEIVCTCVLCCCCVFVRTRCASISIASEDRPQC